MVRPLPLHPRPIHFGIKPFRLQQTLMRSPLDDLPAVQNHDLIRRLNRCEPVCDHKSRPPLLQGLQRLLHQFSDSLSSAEVASSRSKIGASFKMARAIAIR